FTLSDPKTLQINSIRSSEISIKSYPLSTSISQTIDLQLSILFGSYNLPRATLEYRIPLTHSLDWISDQPWITAFEDFETSKMLTKAVTDGRTLYTGAYLTSPGKSAVEFDFLQCSSIL